MVKRGPNLEGKSLEEGGLIQQDTDGAVEHVRKTTTYESDSGYDWERRVDEGFSYARYMLGLKKKKGL